MIHSLVLVSFHLLLIYWHTFSLQRLYFIRRFRNVRMIFPRTQSYLSLYRKWFVKVDSRGFSRTLDLCFMSVFKYTPAHDEALFRTHPSQLSLLVPVPLCTCSASVKKDKKNENKTIEWMQNMQLCLFIPLLVWLVGFNQYETNRIEMLSKSEERVLYAETTVLAILLW